MDKAKDIQKLFTGILFGTKSDKFIDNINFFAANMANVRQVLIENNFPKMIVDLVYFPIVFIILILNALRYEMA